MTWRIIETKEVLRLLRRKSLPKNILEKYVNWKTLLETHGPKVLQSLPGFKDHGLAGRLQGLRSSYLNEQWRVVYAVDDGVLLVTVEQVTPHHYKSRRDTDMDAEIKESLDKLFEAFRSPKGAVLARKHIRVPVGRTLRNIRGFAGLTQEQLAAKAGITQTALSAIENGRIELGADRAKRLAKALKIHPSILLFSDWPEGK